MLVVEYVCWTCRMHKFKCVWDDNKNKCGFLTNELQVESYELRVTIYCTSYGLLFRVTIYCMSCDCNIILCKISLI